MMIKSKIAILGMTCKFILSSCFESKIFSKSASGLFKIFISSLILISRIYKSLLPDVRLSLLSLQLTQLPRGWVKITILSQFRRTQFRIKVNGELSDVFLTRKRSSTW